MTMRLLCGAALLGMLFLSAGQVHSGDQKEPDFKKFMELYGTPGPEHKFLQPMVGQWNATAKMYMGPGKEPMTTKGTANRKWIFDKRYLQESYKGDFGGSDFVGTGTTGYDRQKKKYVFTWLDNMGTGIMYAEGEYNPKTKTFTYTYTQDCFMCGKDTKARDVIRIVSKDEHIFEMYRTPVNGEEFKTMEITYTRLPKKAD